MENPDHVDFQWGRLRGKGGVKGDVKFYQSFRYDGVEYSLYDSVYLYTDSVATPHLGILLKIWELSNKKKNVKVLWYFRPDEVSRYLGDLEVHPKEIFLACGTRTGLVNINPLEAIVGKCSVICTSTDERNRQPSLEEVNMADHIFSRTFDVGKFAFSDNLGVKIADTDVQLFFNKSVPETICTRKTNSFLERDNKEVGYSLPELGSPKSAALKKVDSERVMLDILPGERMEALNIGDKFTVAESSGKTPLKPPALITADADPRKSSGKNVVNAVGTTQQLEAQGSAADILEGINANNYKAPHLCSIDDHDRYPSKKGVSTTCDVKVPSRAPLPSDARLSAITKDSQRGNEHFVKRKYTDRTGDMDTRAPKKIRNGDQRQSTAQIDTAERKVSKAAVTAAADKTLKGTFTKSPIGASSGLSKVIKNNDKTTSLKTDKSWKGSHKKMIEKRSTVYGQVVDVTRRPDADRSNWFTNLPWEDRVKAAYTEGTLVLLQNLDPTYSSSDVEDIVWHGFRESCSAKVIPSNTAVNPLRGEALIIMKTKEAAYRILQELQDGCLLLPNGRLLMGTTGVPVPPRLQTAFPGHLLIARIKLQMQKDNRKAVSTSHSAQSNTLEYDMAMEWRLLEERFMIMYRMLFKLQREELKEQKEKLTVKGH